MRVAVYSIALNEEKFIRRWYESAKEADYLLIADTGSSDKTVEIAQELGIDVKLIHISPWRFDDARNASLALIPSEVDICIQLDLDEVLSKDWRPRLEETFSQGANKISYRYVWSWLDADETQPNVAFIQSKIHSRTGFRWKHICHEVLVHHGETSQVTLFSSLEIHHHPDHKKSRSNYLGLLARAVQEDPTSSRDSYYFARELYFANKFAESKLEFLRYLELPGSTWNFERSKAKRYLALVDREAAVRWLLESHLECPSLREPIVELAQALLEQNQWNAALHYAQKAMSITDRDSNFGSEGFAWGALPSDIAAVASYHLGDKQAAIKYATRALSFDPENQRIIRNLSIFMSELE